MMLFNCDSPRRCTQDTALLRGHVHCRYICVCVWVCVYLSVGIWLYISYTTHCVGYELVLCSVIYFVLCDAVLPCHNTVTLHVLSSDF